MSGIAKAAPALLPRAMWMMVGKWGSRRPLARAALSTIIQLSHPRGKRHVADCILAVPQQPLGAIHGQEWLHGHLPGFLPAARVAGRGSGVGRSVVGSVAGWLLAPS